MNNTIIIIIIVAAFAFYLIYSQTSQQKIIIPNMQDNNSNKGCTNCGNAAENTNYRQPTIQSPIQSPLQSTMQPTMQSPIQPPAQPTTNIILDTDNDPYSDPIKKQDIHSMYDHLTYPQQRLPREILEKYNEYYNQNGVYPPFGQATQPMFDNPILNGFLIKHVDENEPFDDNVPSSIPLFRVKSVKNSNRYFYYIVEQRYLSKLELKIPLDHIKLNGTRYNSEFNGLPEIYDGDFIEGISLYPNAKFRVTLYKTHHFP